MGHFLLLLMALGGCLVQGQDDKLDSPEELSCDVTTPLYLRFPHTYLYHLEADVSMNTLLSLRFPRADDGWFRERWTASVEGERVVKWVQRNVDEPAGTETGNHFSWKHTPKTLPVFSKDIQKKSLIQGKKQREEVKKLEKRHHDNNIVVEEISSRFHQNNFTYMRKEAINSSEEGYIENYATKTLTTGLDADAILDIQLISDNQICPLDNATEDPAPCDRGSPYRTPDGSCNNLREPTWGKSFTPFRRLFPPEYADGVAAPRVARDKGELPNARKISLALKEFPISFSSCFSLFQMSFGQFIDHDLTATPTAKGVDRSPITCCSDKVLQDPSLVHPECFPISIDINDPFYTVYGKTCQEFVRSLPGSSCHFGPREQQNQLTAYIDGSAVYGSNKEHSDSLRTFRDGKLSTYITREGQELLPKADGSEEGCSTAEEQQDGLFCFKSGDERVNEHVLLTLLTTLFAREHNRIAKQLKGAWPNWDDEKLFQETRRIVAAEIQHITYNEFLSGLLGPLLVKGLDLNPRTGGEFFTGYSDRTNAGIANEFAAAALRCGHSMVPEHSFTKNSADEYSADELGSVVFHPAHMHSSKSVRDLFKGALSQSIGRVDQSFSSQITGQLFKMDTAMGLDLVALNIQRGRDHGLAGYVVARRECGFPPIHSFLDLNDIFDAEVVAMLRKLYRQVADIDLFVGAIAEKALPGGLVGPTFACILSDQFIRNKRGDRFWYENIGQSGSFNSGQLTTLHEVSLARVICDNFPEVTTLQRWPLQLPGAQNPILSCNSSCIPTLDLTAWGRYR